MFVESLKPNIAKKHESRVAGDTCANASACVHSSNT